MLEAASDKLRRTWLTKLSEALSPLPNLFKIIQITTGSTYQIKSCHALTAYEVYSYSKSISLTSLLGDPGRSQQASGTGLIFRYLEAHSRHSAGEAGQAVRNIQIKPSLGIHRKYSSLTISRSIWW